MRQDKLKAIIALAALVGCMGETKISSPKMPKNVIPGDREKALARAEARRKRRAEKRAKEAQDGT